jgi:ribose transport system permease protein
MKTLRINTPSVIVRAFKHNPIVILDLTLLIALYIMYRESFIAPTNIRSMLNVFTTVMLLSIGPSFVVVTGGLDISYVGIWMLGGIILWLLKDTMGLFAILIYPLVGLFIGTVNSILHVKVKIPSFILTLSVLLVTSSVTSLIALGVAREVRELAFITMPLIPMVPTGFLLLIPITIIAIYILSFTKVGIYLFAIGSNEEGARQAGVSVEKYKSIAFILSGLFTGVSSIILFSHLGCVSPIELDLSRDVVGPLIAITLGGTPLSGGSGGPNRTIWGALTYVLVYDAVALSGLDPFVLRLATGIMLFIAVIMGSRAIKGIVM